MVRRSGVGERARLFAAEPKSELEREVREAAAEHANELDVRESKKMPPLVGMTSKEANKVLNRKSAKISRALRIKYTELLENEVNRQLEKYTSLKAEVDRYQAAHNERFF